MLKPAGGFEAFGITPIPEENNVLHTCSLLIGSFGFVYYWASKDLYANYDLVWMGCVISFAFCVSSLSVFSRGILLFFSPAHVVLYKSMAMKAANFVVAAVDIYTGTISWQYLLLLAPDIVLVVVFHSILQEVKEQLTKKKVAY